jgi:hypothetical protein
VTDEQASARPDPVALRDGYEQLRERVLAGRADGWRLGHAVLARQGVAGWIAAHATTGVTAAADAPTARSTTAASASATDCGQLVAVLAEMALAHAA